MSGSRRKSDALRREIAARGKRRERRTKPDRHAQRAAAESPASTEASRALIQALRAHGLAALAGRAWDLEFDENYSPHLFPQRELIKLLMLAGAEDLVRRVTAGDFDATAQDMADFYATERGRREKAQAATDLASLAPELREQLEQVMQRLGHDRAAQDAIIAPHLARMRADLGLGTDPAC